MLRVYGKVLNEECEIRHGPSSITLRDVERPAYR